MHQFTRRIACALPRHPQALLDPIPGNIEVLPSVEFWGPTWLRSLQVQDKGKKRAAPSEQRGDGMRAARALRGPEWQHHFENIVDMSVGSHNVDGKAYALLKNNLGTEQLLTPPKYSGDFMQVIEHCHAITMREYYRRYMQDGGSSWDAAEQWSHMSKAFFAVTKVEWLRKCVLRVPILAAEVRRNYGRYVDSKYI